MKAQPKGWNFSFALKNDIINTPSWLTHTFTTFTLSSPASPACREAATTRTFSSFATNCSYKPSPWIIVKTWKLCGWFLQTAHSPLISSASGVQSHGFSSLMKRCHSQKQRQWICLKGRLCFGFASVTGWLTVLKVTVWRDGRWDLGIKDPPRAVMNHQQRIKSSLQHRVCKWPSLFVFFVIRLSPKHFSGSFRSLPCA